MKFKPFGYKVDYDREIAQDERDIREFEAALANGWTHEDRSLGLSLPELVVYAAGGVEPFAGRVRYEALGLSPVDVAELAVWVLDNCLGDLPPKLQELVDQGQELPGWHARGEIVHKLVSAHYHSHVLTEEQTRAALKKAKASLARHRRNREKHGK